MQRIADTTVIHTFSFCRWKLVVCMLVLSYSASAQVIHNKGATITIAPGSKIYIPGSYHHYTSPTPGSIDNSGEIHIQDSLFNNATNSNVFNAGTNRPTLGKVIFRNAVKQRISGSGLPVIFYDFTLQNSLSDFKLIKPFELDGTLNFTTGNIDLNGQFIDLDDRGTLSNETNNNRIFGSSGYVRARKNLSFVNTEIADLGFAIDASGYDFGYTVIKRSHFPLNPFTPNGNINRFFDFHPTNPGQAPVNSITLDYFANEKLPAHNAADYKLFHSYKDGFTWIKEQSAPNDLPEIDFTVMAMGVNHLGTSAQGRSLLTISEGNCVNGPVIDLGPLSKDICQGASFEIRSDPGQQIYTWKKDGVIISGETTNKITVNQAALYELQVVDANGCEGSDNITVNVKQTPIADFQAANFACHGTVSNFTNLSSSPDGTLTYAWDFGDPSVTTDVATAATPSYTYTNSGNFNATLVVKSQYGCVSTLKTNSVIVNPLPAANFSATQVCRTDATTFSNNAVAGISYSWDFGSGNTSAMPAPQFTFNAAGTHPVTLLASNLNTTCSKSVTKDVVVNPRPIADFSTAAICRPNEILFTNTSVISAGSLSHEWDFGDGEVASVSDPFKLFQQAGTYDVTLTTSSNLGCKETITKQVSASLPVPIFTGNVVTCGAQISLDANPGGRFDGGTFKWSDNSTSAQLTVTNSGNYSVTVSMPDGCETTASLKVTLNTIIAPNLGTNIQACGSHTLDAGFYPGGKYTWSTDAATQTITVTQSATYSVEVVDQNGCVGNASVNVQINLVPIVDLGADQILCDSKTTQLDAGTSGNIYLWSNGSAARFIQVGATAQYSVKVTNGFGCFATDLVRVTVLPPLKVDLGPDKVICGGTSLLLDAGILNVSYQWGSSAGSNGSSRTLNVDKGGKYWVSVFSADGCVAADTMQVNETSNTLSAEFLSASLVSPGDTIQFVNVSWPLPFTSSWDFGNGQTSAQEDPTMIYYAEGDFKVSLTVTNGVCTDARSKTIQVKKDATGKEPSGGRRQDDIISSRAYPNPTRDLLHLEVELSSEMKVRVQVNSMIGVSFYMKEMTTQNIDEVFDLSGVNPGVYVVVIITENQSKSIRVLKQ